MSRRRWSRGIVVGVLQAATPLVFWLAGQRDGLRAGLAVIASVYVGFLVADGRPKVIAVESSVTFASRRGRRGDHLITLAARGRAVRPGRGRHHRRRDRSRNALRLGKRGSPARAVISCTMVASGRCGHGVPEGRGRRRRLRRPRRRNVAEPRTSVDAGIRHAPVRHEAGGGHAAEGYAKASLARSASSSPPQGRARPTSSTPRPTDAMIYSAPLVAFRARCGPTCGYDGFQEADTFGITMPIVKHCFMIQHPTEIPRVVHEAFHIARTGRLGRC